MRALYVNIVNPAKNDLFSRLTYYENEVLSIYCCPRRRRCLCNTGRSVTPPTNRYTKANNFFFVSYHLLLCADVAYFSLRVVVVVVLSNIFSYQSQKENI